MKHVAIGISVAVLVYLAFSFAKWDINVGNWEEPERIGCAVFGVFCALCAAASSSLRDSYEHR